MNYNITSYIRKFSEHWGQRLRTVSTLIEDTGWNNIYIYLGKLQYFTNLNSSAIWGWFLISLYLHSIYIYTQKFPSTHVNPGWAPWPAAEFWKPAMMEFCQWESENPTAKMGRTSWNIIETSPVLWHLMVVLWDFMVVLAGILWWFWLAFYGGLMGYFMVV